MIRSLPVHFAHVNGIGFVEGAEEFARVDRPTTRLRRNAALKYGANTTKSPPGLSTCSREHAITYSVPDGTSSL